MFSVLITTYGTPDYLIECLNEFKSFNNIEVIVGIDGCYETKKKLTEFTKPKNFRFYFFSENIGTYKVKNNLISECTNDIILFFDSDDIPNKNIFQRYDKNFDLIRLRFKNFGLSNSEECAWGVFFVSKKICQEINGFQNWLCNADVEFINRVQFNKYNIKSDKVISFRRRLHQKNLTILDITNDKSEIRKEYQNIIKTNKQNKNWVNPDKIDYEYSEL